MHRVPDLSAAVVVWTGYGETAWPARDGERLARRFGTDHAADLLPLLRRLEQDFSDSDAHLDAPDLLAAAEAAAARFRSLHPEVSSAAVEALAWCYTFDCK